MRLRRAVLVIVIAGGVAAATLLIGLITNAASAEAEWPQWLRPIQTHPWQSLGIVSIFAVGLTILFALVSDPASDKAQGKRPLATDEAAPSGVAVQRTLPRDSPVFTNRVELLQRLIDALDDPGHQVLPVYAIDGMPGVGKTTFAVHAGHALKDRFPDGQVFVNLNGHTPGRKPAEPADALASLLISDGVAPALIPVGSDTLAVTDARSAMWRSRLADRSILLILDNAASYEQIEPLLPSGGRCLVIVTSRKRLTALEGVTLQMEALDPEDAAGLLVRLSGRPAGSLDATIVAELASLCGYLPLALSLLAAQLRNHQKWTAADLKARLLAARDRLGEMRAGERAVAAAFDLSYQDLPVRRQMVFRRLGLLAGTGFDAYSTAALTGLPLADAASELDALYDDHLIEEISDHRFRMHDLVRDYSRGLARQDDGMDRAQATERLGSYYLATITAANRLIGRSDGSGASFSRESGIDTPELDSRTRALDWLEAERPNVLAFIDEANSQAQYAIVVRLAAAMAPFLRHAGPWDQAASLHRAAGSAAKASGDPKAEGEALTNLGIANRLMARYPEAVEALSAGISIYRDASDKQGLTQALNQIGIVWYLTADYADAAQAQTEALEIAREIGNRLAQGNALADLGMVRRQTSDFQAAESVQTEALTVYQELGDTYGQANALRDLGIVYMVRGEYAKATQRQNEALQLYTDLHDRLHQAYALNEMGVVRRLSGDLAGAMEAHCVARDYYTELGDRFGQANSIRHLGVLHRLNGEPDLARQAQEEALAMYRELGAKGGQAASLNEQGVLATNRGEIGPAVAGFGQAQQIFRDLHDQLGESEVLNNWGAALLASDDATGSTARFTEALELARRIGCPLEETRALDGLGRAGMPQG